MLPARPSRKPVGVARAACPERAEGPASRRQPGANQKAIVAEIDENAIARHLMEVLDLRSPPGRWPILARSQLARWTLRTELTQVVVHVEVGQTHPLGVGHAAEMGMRRPVEVSGLAREMVHEVLQIAQIGVENSGGGAPFSDSCTAGIRRPGQTIWCADIFPQRRGVVGWAD